MNAPLVWSRELPTVPGWYWHRDPSRPGSQSVSNVFRIDPAMGVSFDIPNSIGKWIVGSDDGIEFAGPIPEPGSPRGTGAGLFAPRPTGRAKAD